jgi:asparagine synthase (glutamine-hydrolysing)
MLNSQVKTMSVQFGRCIFDGKPVDPQEFEEVRPVLAPYGPDGEGFICKDNFGVLYRAFHTTKESRRETQPYVSASGFVLTWDGRLDNREELIGLVGGEVSCESTDLDIVAAAYQRWRNDAFAKLIGDWALSVWEPKNRSLILAKDFVGTRHLYYTVEKEEVTWCTILDPLVLLARRPFRVEEEYIAGWLALLPPPELTPYVGIQSVPPSSFVCLARGTQKVRRYWDFNPTKKVRYDTDGEYEVHFRAVFSESVRRRLRSDSPVLAELSGGMDSSSIVCLADKIMEQEATGTPRLDTISYYDESEPAWDERPYFTKVEQKRGRVGHHIDIGSRYDLLKTHDEGRFAATPALVGQSVTVKQFSKVLGSQQNRVVLSGIGGDEVLGGVPTPTPELADLAARAELRTFGRQLVAWALVKKKPLWHLLAETLAAFFTSESVFRAPEAASIWLEPAFMARHRAALQGYPRRLHFLGPPPSFQENLNTLEGLRRQLAHSPLAWSTPYEMRYAYLDRELLEFVYAIPREQIVRPLQRRSLMRRALARIVPHEVLNRRRKGFVVRRPIAAISAEWPRLGKLTDDMLSASAGIVNSQVFAETLAKARRGGEIHVSSMMRTLELETWLRHVSAWGTVRTISATHSRRPKEQLLAKSSAG